MPRTPTSLALAAGAAILLSGQAAAAQDYPSSPTPPTSALIDDAVIDEIRDWVGNPVVAMMVAAQNRRYGDITEAEIKELDQQWRAERESDEQPLVASILSNPLSFHLTQVQAGSLGLYTEIFVMDKNGLNVGQSAVTSDFWQGDEAKFQKTYPVGATAVFVDEAEKHEDSGTWRTQVSMTLGGFTSIGAVTVEVNLTELARRRAATM